jgi:hypothetical protein
MERMVQKLSVVYVSTDERIEIFRSFEEMPEKLRQKLIRTARTSQVNTLVIANDKGREMLEAKGWKKPSSEPASRKFLLRENRWAQLGLIGIGLALLGLTILLTR